MLRNFYAARSLSSVSDADRRKAGNAAQGRGIIGAVYPRNFMFPTNDTALSFGESFSCFLLLLASGGREGFSREPERKKSEESARVRFLI